MRILGLCNPTSGARPERLALLQRFADSVTDSGGQMQVIATTDAADAQRALTQAQLGPEDILLLSGGDGTIQEAVSWLLYGGDGAVRTSEPCAAAELPLVALLPAGSTNMTALDINATRGWERSLESFLCHVDRSAVRAVADRRLISVQDGDRVHAGFFVGGGAIVRGIEYCNNVLWAGGAARRERTAGLAMLRTIWGVLRRQPPFDGVDALALSAQFAPDSLIDGSTAHAGAPADAIEPVAGALLFASSTLERLVVGARPFWGVPASEPLRYVLVERDASLFRGLPGLLGVPGFARPVARRGFHSHNCTSLVLRMSSAYAIDGELFVPQSGALELSVDRSLRFLVL